MEFSLENKIFKNYKDLCSFMQWEPTGGETKKCKMNRLSTIYDVTLKGHQIIIGDKKEEEFFNTNFKEDKEEYEKALDILNRPIKNSQYLSNNLLLFIHYLKKSMDNRYSTYTIRQMREFGFLRKGLKPDYANSSSEFYLEGPYFSIEEEFEKEINKKLEEQHVGKRCINVFREIFGILRDRYGKLMDVSCSKFVNEESIASFGTWITKSQWDYFKKHYNQSINIMRREMEMVGIEIDKNTKQEKERKLTPEETDAYFKIRNRIMEKENVQRMNYDDMSKVQVRLFNRIARACSEELGFTVTYRKLYYSPLKDLNAFVITEEDAKKAMEDNNRKMRDTLKTYFRRKYLIANGVYKIYEECIDYITDLCE